MKAILEFAAPESCAECRFFDNDGCRCWAALELIGLIYNIERAPFCPLKIVPEGYEVVFQPKFSEKLQKAIDDWYDGQDEELTF